MTTTTTNRPRGKRTRPTARRIEYAARLLEEVYLRAKGNTVDLDDDDPLDEVRRRYEELQTLVDGLYRAAYNEVLDAEDRAKKEQT